MAKKYQVQFFSRKPRPRDEGLIFEARIPARSAAEARDRFKRYFSKEFELYSISALDGPHILQQNAATSAANPCK